MTDRMIIVGAGQAGGRAALTLRETGHVGPIVLIGAEPDAPYERPPLSKDYLTGEREPGEFTFASAAALDAAGVEFLPGRTVEAIDRDRREVQLSSGERLVYHRLLLATGRRVRRLPTPAGLADRVLYLRDLADARKLRARLADRPRLVVIGGGFIGLEVAASAVRLGCRPVVIEQATQLMGRAVPAELAAIVQARHEAAGVALRLGVGVEGIEPDGPGLRVRLTDGGAVAADLALVGIGAVPRAELAEAAGLAVDRGIIVDATLRTSDPAIYAAGDVCACPGARSADLLRLESWQNADAQGALAARNMLGAGLAYAELPWFWSDQYELSLQIAGHPELAATSVGRHVGAEGRLLFHLDREQRPVGVSGVGPAAFAREFKLARLLLERAPSLDPGALRDPETRLKSLLR